MSWSLLWKFSFRPIFFYRSRVIWILVILAFGLFGLLALNGVGQSFKGAIEERAKDILGSDLALRSRRILSAEEVQKIEQFAQKNRLEVARVFELFSMFRVKDVSQLVQLKAFTSNFPFYGAVKLKNRPDLASLFKKSESFAVFPDETLLPLLDASVGDEGALGQANISIEDAVVDDPSLSWRSFDLAPRLYLSVKTLEETGLVGPNSLVSRQWHFKGRPNQDWKLLEKRAKDLFDDPQISVRTPQSSSQSIGRMFRYLKDFLGLLGLVGLALSLLGANYLLEGLWQEQKQSLLTQKLLGLSARRMGLILWAQVVVLVASAFILGLLFFQLVIPAIEAGLRESVALELSIADALRPEMFVILFVVTSLLLFPWIQKLNRLRPKELLEEQSVGGIPKRHWEQRILIVVEFFCFYGAAVWFSRSFFIGSFFTGVCALAVGLAWPVFYGVASVLKKQSLKRKWAQRKPLLHLALKDLFGSPRANFILFVSLLLGSLLITLVTQIPHGLRWEWGVTGEKAWKTPDFFVFDIQPEQVGELLEWTKKRPLSTEALSPMIRARLTKVNGIDLDQWNQKTKGSREEQEQKRLKDRGMNLSYRSELGVWEEVIEGTEFAGVYDPDTQERPFISVEFRYAKRLGLELGDKLHFVVEGEKIIGEVKNFRKIDWLSFRPNFFVQFQSGVLNQFGKTYLLSLFFEGITEKRDWQTKLVKSFPNLSVVDVRKVVSKIKSLFERLILSVYVMSAFALLAGLFVVVAILNHQLELSKRTTGLYKVVGMTSKQLVRKSLWFYGILLIWSIAFGLGLGVLVSKMAGKFLFYTYWPISWQSAAFSFVVLFVISLGPALLLEKKNFKIGPKDLLGN